MATKKKMLMSAAGNAGGAGLDIDEIFSTYLYEGTSSARNIVNDINLADNGGLVWIKSRTEGGSQYDGFHILCDSERGQNKTLNSDSNKQENWTSFGNTVTGFNNTNGFSIGDSDYVNYNGHNFASWTFRKAPKFFTCLTYTGNGVAGRTISHDLGTTVGMIVVKRTDASGADWIVYHRSEAGKWGKLNETGAFGTSYAPYYFGNNSIAIAPTSTEFTVGNAGGPINASGGTYVAYLFAHNDGDGEFGPDGNQDIIKCGSYTGNDSTDGPTVNLGFEPQFLLIKSSTANFNWMLIDNMRGAPTGGNTAYLKPNTSDEENTASGNLIDFTSTGFKLKSGNAQTNNNETYIYMAIRRGPLAPPESATEVFDVYTGSDAYPTVITTGFTADSLLGALRSGNSNNFISGSRLTGSKSLKTSSTDAQGNGLFSGTTNACFMRNDGILPSTFGQSNTVYYTWKRAPGYFDVVAYTGNGTARTINHNLGVAPEMMWVKSRTSSTASYQWWVYHKDLGNTKYLNLNQTYAENPNTDLWNSTTPTESVFTLGATAGVNWYSNDYIAYLFASLPGISKVGSYTGDGTTDGSKVIDCGFTSGARFVLIKTSSHSDPWLVFDSVRGIVSSGNDPYLRLNDTSAEQAGLDVLDPQSSGFGVRGNLTNVNNYTYIFYAIA